MNRNEGFQNADTGEQRKGFAQSNLQYNKKVFAQFIELFMGYKSAHSVFLCLMTRPAQNRLYEK